MAFSTIDIIIARATKNNIMAFFTANYIVSGTSPDCFESPIPALV